MATHSHQGEGPPLQATRFAAANTVLQPVFDGLDPTLTAAQVDLLTNKLVPDAIGYWEAALRVHPVEGPLFAERACQQKWLSNSKCRTYVATTRCGDHGNQHEVEIPAYMFKQQVRPGWCRDAAGSTPLSDVDCRFLCTRCVGLECVRGATGSVPKQSNVRLQHAAQRHWGRRR